MEMSEQIPEDLFETGMLHDEAENEDDLLVDGAAEDADETDEGGDL